MQKTKIALAATLIGLAGYSSHGATIFELTAEDVPTETRLYWLEAGGLSGASIAEKGWDPSDAVITADETTAVFWERMITGAPIGYTTIIGPYGSGTLVNYILGTPESTENVNYLHVTFTESSITVRGLDFLEGLEDVGPRLAPDGGVTAGLLGLSLAALGFVRQRRFQ